ncbi:uncharacterized protein Dwil_GK14318 [Drosophila willistoni]|uniref:Uncharacterized protein n=1 Tax=Drosophila willistoni TaxID=7260 RepID=B4NII9_DROWI|nr:uncharacterized protein Dwil_GK14318 [Drosophila willistoni]
MALIFIAAKNIEKCHFGDTICLIRTMNSIIRHYPKGISEIGLPPLDVTHFNLVSVLNTTTKGPIWLNFHLRDNINKGFNNATIIHVDGFDQDPTKKQIEIKARIPRILHEANYDMEGKFLLFKANSTGKLTSDFQNFELTLIVKVFVEYRQDKRFLKIYSLVPNVKIDRWIIWMDDLYKENSDLTIALNRAFNDHWVEFWNDLEPGLLTEFKISFTGLLTTIFDRVSYDDMFLSQTEIYGSSLFE